MYYTYILTNKNNTVLYIGVTNNLARRIFEHQEKLIPGFTKRYNVNKLVYAEEFDNPYDAISREKQIKNWHRDWKINLIKTLNPDFVELNIDET